MMLYRTRTQDEYNWLMEKLEEEGNRWVWVSGGTPPTEDNCWRVYRERTVIEEEGGELSYMSYPYYLKKYSNPLIEVSDMMAEEKEWEEPKEPTTETTKKDTVEVTKGRTKVVLTDDKVLIYVEGDLTFSAILNPHWYSGGGR